MLKTIVLAGINGSGKTTLLKLIYNVLLSEINRQDSEIMIDIDNEEKELIKRTLGGKLEDSEYFNVAKIDKMMFTPYEWKRDKKQMPRIVFLPTEINFSNLEVKTRNYIPAENFSFYIDKNKINDVPSYLVSLVNTEIFKYQELPLKKYVMI